MLKIRQGVPGMTIIVLDHFASLTYMKGKNRNLQEADRG